MTNQQPHLQRRCIVHAIARHRHHVHAVALAPPHLAVRPLRQITAIAAAAQISGLASHFNRNIGRLHTEA
jgi:hypothetical protein